MWRAFNLIDCNWKNIPHSSGAAIYERNNKIVETAIDSFISNGIVDGTKLSAHWFPKITADVFISHSHNDQEDAIKCAGWLKDHFGLDSFIDSCVWGFADDLLKVIDDKHCKNLGEDTYSYSKRNRSTSHVHMMLATALNEMIDAAECVVFINTSNSITTDEAIRKTKSPWLFFELAAMRHIRRRKPERMHIIEEQHFSMGTKKSAELKVEYVVPLHELTALGADQLNSWLKAWEKTSEDGANALDVLYDRHPEKGSVRH